jgi:hypothetical protein
MSETKMLTTDFVQQPSGEGGEAELDAAFVPSGDAVTDACIVKLTRAYTEALARIAELQAQLAAKDSTISDLRDADKRAVKIAAGQVEEVKRELEAQLKEANEKCEALQSGFSIEKEMRERAEAGIVAIETRRRCQTEELEQALQGMLDWYEDENGAGFCECDKSVDLVCRACVARGLLAQESEGE